MKVKYTLCQGIKMIYVLFVKMTNPQQSTAQGDNCAQIW